MTVRIRTIIVQHNGICDRCDFHGPCVEFNIMPEDSVYNCQLCRTCCVEHASAMQTFFQAREAAQGRESAPEKQG